jgi:hypothetical protein
MDKKEHLQDSQNNQEHHWSAGVCWGKVISQQYHPTKHNHGLPDLPEFNIKDGISIP